MIALGAWWSFFAACVTLYGFTREYQARKANLAKPDDVRFIKAQLLLWEARANQTTNERA